MRDDLLGRDSDHRREGDAPSIGRHTCVEEEVAADRRTAAAFEKHSEVGYIGIVPSMDGAEAAGRCCVEDLPSGLLQVEFWPRSIWVMSSS